MEVVYWLKGFKFRTADLKASFVGALGRMHYGEAGAKIIASVNPFS